MIYVDTIISIIRDIAYIVAQIMKGKSSREKLKLLAELEDLKNKISQAIDTGDEALLSLLLDQKKEIEQKIKISNTEQDKEISKKKKAINDKKRKAIIKIKRKLQSV